jgi:membrane associated rhomboid family serine protease
VGAALFSSHVFLLASKNGGCMGLSGITLAFLAIFARMHPQRELGVMLMGIIPVRMQAQVALLALLVWSVLGSIFRIGNVAHAAHLGGLLFGMGYYELWNQRAKLRRIRKKILWQRK